jgi:hypothetical protein
MMLNKFDLIFLSLLFLTVPATVAGMQSDPYTMTNASAGPATPIDDGHWVSVNTLPIETHSIGDSFTISGKTSLPAGSEIVFGAYISPFQTGSPDLLPPAYSGSALVSASEKENFWSLKIDTTNFSKKFRNGTILQMDAVPGEYTLSLGTAGTARYPFTITEKKSVTLITQASVPATTTPAAPTPKTASLNVLLLMITICFIGGVWNIERKKR